MEKQYQKIPFDHRTCRNIKHEGLAIADIAYHDNWMRQAMRQCKALEEIYGRMGAWYRIAEIRFLLTKNIFRFDLEKAFLYFLRMGVRLYRYALPHSEKK